MGRERILPMGRCVPHFFSIVFTLWILFTTSESQDLLMHKYIGCFYDNDTQSVIPNSSSHVKLPNILDCIQGCLNETDMSHAALKIGGGGKDICSCRNDYGVQIPDDNCSLSNPSNGGLPIVLPNQPITSNQSVYVLYSVCQIGTYGHSCDEFCHCKRDIPCKRSTGECPNGCHGNWYGPSCNKTGKSHHYIGCYKDNSPGNRSMPLSAENKGSNTYESCIKLCAEKNMTYAGTQFGSQCFCGDSYRKYGPLAEGLCNKNCSGNSAEICGGANANSVYSVCPAGSYGKGCARRCNCLNGSSCFYGNGSCQSCKPGWSGFNCDVRDCSQNNGDCYSNEKCTEVDLEYSTLKVNVCRCHERFQSIKIWEICTVISNCPFAGCDLNTTTCNITEAGNVTCECKHGYEKLNSTMCTDIDDCLLPSSCNKNISVCRNTLGSFQCVCLPGYGSFDGNGCEASVKLFTTPPIMWAACIFTALVCIAIAIVITCITFICRRKSKCCSRSKTSGNESPKTIATATDNSQKAMSKTLEENLKTKSTTTSSNFYSSARKPATLESNPRQKPTAMAKCPKTKYTIEDKSPKTKPTTSGNKSPKAKASGKKNGLVKSKSPERELSGQQTVIDEVSEKILENGNACEASDTTKPSGRESPVYVNSEDVRRNSATSMTSTYEMPQSRPPDDDQDVYTDLQND